MSPHDNPATPGGGAHDGPFSYQTIRLGRGKHAQPGPVACVMELASMLAGEPFSDRPLSVCPVIGGFLRAYNDTIDTKRRQDLYRCAASVVGTRASAEVQARREEALLRFAEDVRGPSRWPLLRRRRTPDARLGTDRFGDFAVRAMPKPIADDEHQRVLQIIDELIAMGGERRLGMEHTMAPVSAADMATAGR